MSSYYQGLAAGQAFREKQENREFLESGQILSNINPFTENIPMGEGDEFVKTYRNINEEKFNELIGLDKDGKIDTTKMKQLENGFYQINNNDLSASVLNAMALNRSHTDQDGNVQQGEVKNIRVRANDDGSVGAIHFDLKTKQGIVPKTLGFSNDPKDVVMSSDVPGFRAIFNTALRQIYRKSPQGKVGGVATVAMQVDKKFDTNLENERRGLGSPPGESAEGGQFDGDHVDTIGHLSDKAARGEIGLTDAFAQITDIGSTAQDAFDSFNLSQKQKTEAAANEGEPTITREQAREIVKLGSGEGGFFDQSASAQRQILNLVGAPEIGSRLGLNNAEQKALREAKPSQRYTRENITEDVPIPGVPDVTMPMTRQDTRLTEPTPDTITREGVEYQRNNAPQVFAGTDLVYPVDASIEEQAKFVEENKEEMLRVGLSDEFLKNAEEVFNKYEVNEPADLNRIPDDPEVPFGRKEAAWAIAIAMGNVNNNVLTNYQSALNMINTDDINVSDRDAFNTRVGMEQTAAANEARMAGILAQMSKDGLTRATQNAEGFIEDAVEINFFKEYTGPELRRSVGAPLNSGEVNKFTALLQKIKNTGGANGGEIEFDQTTGLIKPGSLSPAAQDVLGKEIGDFLVALAISNGDKEKGGLFQTGWFSDRQNMNAALAGNMSAKIQIRKREVNGKEQIDAILFKDARNNQFIPVISGTEFRNQFPDAVTSGMVMSVIPGS